MINGAHVIVYSTNSEADRQFFKDVLGLPHVDVGEGWLIFGLPPSEVAVHPSEKNDAHELYLMCEDVAALMGDLEERGLSCSPVEDQGWGLVTHVSLPGGGKLGIYQPRHARPPVTGGAGPAAAAKATRAVAKKIAKQVKKAVPAKKAKATVKAVKKVVKKAVAKALAKKPAQGKKQR